MAKVYVKFPKTGLGNMMLVWAHALVFARINGLEIITSSWWGFRWGTLFRRERKKRFYRNYFKETSFVKRNLYRWKLFFTEVVKDPDISELTPEEKQSRKIFLFQKTIRENDLFKFLRDHQALIKEEIFKVLDDKKKEELNKYENPQISMHIRRGDFKIGNQTTPISYFTDIIHLIRKQTGNNFPVTIFTDGTRDEIKELLTLPQVNVAEDKADILDILLMSNSRILILSKDSTFSYWAAFLSDALVIMAYNDWQDQIKKTNEKYVEVRWKAHDPFSTNKLEQLVAKYSVK